MTDISFATLRLGKTSVTDIKLLNAQTGGVLNPAIEISVVCTQVPAELEIGVYTFIWLGSDNNKGIATEWKQGFKAIGKIKDITRGVKYNDESTTVVEVNYIFEEAVNRLDILREAPIAYYWCSSMPIIGLDDHSNQTIRLISTDIERSVIEAFFYVLNSVRPELESGLTIVHPKLKPYFVYEVPNPKGGENSEYRPISFKTGLISLFDRNRILFGAPGTGKSHQLKLDCETLMQSTKGTFERVTFHPEYSYSHFVGSYKPIADDNKEIQYKFVPGPFMRVLVAAYRSGRTEIPQPHLLLIEEINRAKVAAVFGEVFQLLDRDNEGVSEYEIHTTEDVKKYLVQELGGTVDDYAQIRIPDNMFIWSTMNSADQGVFPIDTAFKRRWNFEYLGINDNDSTIGGKIVLGTGTYALEVNWNQIRKALNEKLAVDYRVNEDKLLGPFFLSQNVFAYDLNGDIINTRKFCEAFKSKVIMYLYDDAAKQHKNRLFAGCDNSKYSTVCAAFDEIGISIFGDGFLDLYYRMGA